VKAPDATIYIPELEFSFAGNDKRIIDTIFNHIGGHIFTLEMFAQRSEAERKRLILETVDMLRKCLDLDIEWTWVLVDPSGQSEIERVDELIVHDFVDIPDFAAQS